jgi:ABC-2 type transport system ATP-binding protein
VHAIELIGVSKRYGRRMALDRLDLAVPRGSGVGLLGPNGAGKTTSLRLILGFAAPTEGTLRLAGLPPSDPASRARVGYLPEQLALPDAANVWEFVALHARLAGVAASDIDAEVEAALARTGLEDRARDRLDSLSKGLRQRVGFAQALLADPEILLLDEPTSGLDPLGVRDARDWIQEARGRGCTVLLCSHVLSEVEQTCDRVAILYEGRIAASGATGEIVEPGESLEDAFVRVVRG